MHENRPCVREAPHLQAHCSASPLPSVIPFYAGAALTPAPAEQEHGTCPVTKQPMSQDELLSLQPAGPTKPRDTSGASVPGLLSTLHNVRPPL